MPPAVAVHAISKRYRIGKNVRSVRDLIRNFGRPRQYRWAVRDLSFTLEPGESLGIIGPNGAGKTTVLKILSKVTPATRGQVHAHGRLSALIELGAGFHQDLTGRENIYLNGTILGMRRAEIASRFDRIVEFAGIGEYLDTPVKRYSSGMYARLGFAIAAHVDPDVLLVDEVLAVGDYAFQQQCYARIDELLAKGTALILVSHNMDAIRRVCARSLVMYRGENIFLGPSAEAVVAYSDTIRQAARRSRPEVPLEGGLSERVMTFDAEIERVRLLDPEGRPINVVRSGDAVVVSMDVCFHKRVSQPVFGLTVRAPDGRRIHDSTTEWMKIATGDFETGQQCRVEWTLTLPLLEGEYEVGAGIVAKDLTHFFDRMERALSFHVLGPTGAEGLVDLSAKFRLTNHDSRGADR